MKTLLFDFSNVLLFTKDTVEFSGRTKIDPIFVLNQPLLDYISNLELKRAIFTATTKIYDPAIKAHLTPVFHQFFTTEEIGLDKTSPAAYLSVIEKLKADPAEVMFIDDSPINVASARQAGLSAQTYQNNQQIIELINEWVGQEN